MAFIPVKRDRTSKPPIGTSLRADGHWSTRDLVSAYAFSEGGGRRIFDSGPDENHITISGALNWVNSEFGQGIQFNGTDTYGVTTKNIRFGTDRITILALFKWNPAQTGNRMLLELSTNAGSVTDGFYFNINEPGDDRLRFAAVGNAGWNSSNSVQAIGSAPVSVALVADRTLPGASQQSIYINGSRSTQSNETAANTSVFSAATRQLYLGSRAGTLEYADCLYQGIFLYRRALDPAEIASISANPWQIFEPEVTWYNPVTGQIIIAWIGV